MPRGGKRKGSGRHPVPNKKIKKSITLRPDHIEKIKGEKASVVIENALDKYFKGDVMRIKGLSKIQKQLKKMRFDLENKIDDNHDNHDNHDKCGTTGGDRVDERLNSAWMIIDSAINELKDMEEI